MQVFRCSPQQAYAPGSPGASAQAASVTTASAGGLLASLSIYQVAILVWIKVTLAGSGALQQKTRGQRFLRHD